MNDFLIRIAGILEVEEVKEAKKRAVAKVTGVAGKGSVRHG